ncbi:RlpA-like double-psi beta-barrel-protein domain-containing protein-containing protein [Amanita rubescens]|nr:RlpA-like double-psi beta-barrel-protein domain-containing protein-containing protein [Amanita rubescens]
MHFGILTTLTAFSLIILAQAHERVGLKHHFKRFPKAEWAANSSNGMARRQLFDNAKFTYYEAGLGACGKTSTDGDFIVAINTEQYAGGALCFETVTITAMGKTTTAQIVDECMGCPYAGLDFSPSLFKFFAPEGDGVIYGTWVLGSVTVSTSTKTSATPTKTWSPPSSTSTSSRTTSASSSTTTSASVTTSSATPTATPVSVSLDVIVDLNLLYVQLGSLVVQAPNV